MHILHFDNSHRYSKIYSSTKTKTEAVTTTALSHFLTVQIFYIFTTSVVHPPEGSP